MPVFWGDPRPKRLDGLMFALVLIALLLLTAGCREQAADPFVRVNHVTGRIEIQPITPDHYDVCVVGEGPATCVPLKSLREAHRNINARVAR